MDIGCYPINVARWFFGSEPDEVLATVRRDPTFGTDVLTSAVLDFDGRQATFVCSTQLESDQRVHLLGTTGRLEVEIPFNIPPDRPTRGCLASGGDPPVAPGLTVLRAAAVRSVHRPGRRLQSRRARRRPGAGAAERRHRQPPRDRADPRRQLVS